MSNRPRILQGSVAPTEDSGSSGTTTHDRLDGRRSDEVRSMGSPPGCTVPASLPDAFSRSPSAPPVSSPATIKSVEQKTLQRHKTIHDLLLGVER